MRTPLVPVLIPSMLMPLITTLSVAPAEIVMPLVPLAMIVASTLSQSSLIDLVIVTVPKLAGSRQLISPPAAVFEIEPAKVRHGAVRLHGLTSSPTPETQVRVACAEAGVASGMANSTANAAHSARIVYLVINTPNDCPVACRPKAARSEQVPPKCCDRSGKAVPFVPPLPDRARRFADFGEAAVSPART